MKKLIDYRIQFLIMILILSGFHFKNEPDYVIFSKHLNKHLKKISKLPLVEIHASGLSYPEPNIDFYLCQFIFIDNLRYRTKNGRINAHPRLPLFIKRSPLLKYLHMSYLRIDTLDVGNLMTLTNVKYVYFSDLKVKYIDTSSVKRNTLHDRFMLVDNNNSVNRVPYSELSKLENYCVNNHITFVKVEE